MEDIARKVAQLRTFSREHLLDLWQKLYRRAAPRGLRRELLVPFLSYKLQECALGGLKPSTRAELRRIARDIEKSGVTTRPILPQRIKPGTRIVREWGGQTHEVTVVQSGYEYRNTVYRSLSEIARKITGTRWSGPAFFHLKTAR
jgi:hypothetical protein